MENTPRHSVCPMEKAGSLDSWLRKLINNPKKILAPYITLGMTVLDLGCGPGFFTVPLATMIGPNGKVIATDMQQGMLDKVQEKIQSTPLAERIELRLTPPGSLGVSTPVDFVLLFHVLHELPDQASFLQQIKNILKPNARVFIAEPKHHVSEKEFNQSLKTAERTGFTIIAQPKIRLSYTALLK